MSHNLALLPSAERQRIELIKQAHLLVWRRRRNDISRQDVIDAIEAHARQARKTEMERSAKPAVTSGRDA